MTSRRPSLRRQVTASWDLAPNWVVDEPHEHHTALPHSIMLALVALALLWGWSREAALIAMTWVGVLRVGEVLMAKREDLTLPKDAAPGVLHAILEVKDTWSSGTTPVYPIDQVRLLREKYLISYFLSNSQDANRICITYR